MLKKSLQSIQNSGFEKKKEPDHQSTMKSNYVTSRSCLADFFSLLILYFYYWFYHFSISQFLWAPSASENYGILKLFNWIKSPKIT